MDDQPELPSRRGDRTVFGTRRLFAFCGALAVLTVPGLVRAYPQWQFTSGASRCTQCHFAPGGGGLITGYGRDAVGEELSTFEGDGAFLHGAAELPSLLTIGGNLRGALLANDVQDPSGTSYAAFPMQADLNVRLALPWGISVAGSVGLRGQVRDEEAVVPTQNYQPISTSRLVSREHHITWMPARQGPYAKLGRYYAPFGLRLAEHVTYVRRDLGFNLLEESYNLSLGYLAAEWEAHVTGFLPDELRHMGATESGVAAYYEHRLLDRLALGGQMRLGFDEGMDRLVTGVVGKFHLPILRTLFLAEANLVHQMFDSGQVGSRQQVVGALGFAVLPVRGLMITVLGERNHVDTDVRDAAWNALTGFVNWFPYAHVELQLIGRLQFAAGEDPAKTAMAQIHYFL